ncbi:hypothetical protein D9757_011804 [Collybiopsis confluens]|uniref:Uncharacterized protein n=1 Tax=Collybiopsis confluens TaxID=2823264 RepID=A0A8H5LP96_9AGAR|nr:hypothetical protein D9757_011804 [Collybiopsis confluens]
MSSFLNLDDTLGAAFIGYSVSCVIFGIFTMQAMSYFVTYRADPWRLKVLVGFIWCIEFVHQSLISHALYHYTISKAFWVAVSNNIRASGMVSSDTGPSRCSVWKPCEDLPYMFAVSLMCALSTRKQIPGQVVDEFTETTGAIRSRESLLYSIPPRDRGVEVSHVAASVYYNQCTGTISFIQPYMMQTPIPSRSEPGSKMEPGTWHALNPIAPLRKTSSDTELLPADISMDAFTPFTSFFTTAAPEDVPVDVLVDQENTGHATNSFCVIA